ncbi:MAG: hypothetical protein HWN68_12810 [Desulfobacterales bacterium]|nr:hypothetical protein [Desulfobacterales bacterium]
MVFKCPFLKKRIVADYDPTADETKTWDLTDDVLAAIWITIKGDFVAADKDDDLLMALVTSIQVDMGGFTVLKYINTLTAVVMNMLLKQSRYMLIGSDHEIDDIKGVCFPLLFGAPYLNTAMALPKSLDNRKTLTLGLDIANADFDDLLVDISEVILPNARPVGFIKQEEVSLSARGTGDKDVWLQTNWDLLKLLFKCPTVPVEAAWTQTVNQAGLEIDDFMWGYNGVPWTHLHGELMDEITGMAGIESHTHSTLVPDETGMATNLEHWIRYFAVMDFFYNKDLKWRAPLSGSSTAKLKLNYGVDEAMYFAQANYVPVSRVE